MTSQTRVALVTGGSRGIGRAISLRLARDGVKVGVNYLSNSDAAQDVVREIEQSGSQGLAIQGDITQSKDVEHAIQEVMGTWGQLDILVNNAGTIKDSLLIRMDIQDFDSVIDIHLRGTFLCTKLALRSMIKNRWGRVINIGSVVGLSGNIGQANYAAAKAGVIGFTRSVAKEVASRGITVNCIAPGYITTDIVETLSDSLKQRILERVHARRFGTAEEVADLTGFLATESAGYLTGQVIAIDGGLSLGG